MYKIIGGDQQEYGPASADQVKRWIGEGRANAATLVQAEGSAEWQPLKEFPEFAEALGITSSEPPVSGTPPTNGMAIAGFVMGILGLVCCGPVFSTLGLVFSGLAISQINNAPEQYGGKPLAIAGVVISLIGFVLFFALLMTGTVDEIIRRLKELES